jgi:23S rRNA pseudouridine2605 synthase
LIAHAGLASRRAAEEMIRAGRVTVDGGLAHLGQKIDPETARVEVDGIPLPTRPGLVYYLLFKPAGVVSTASDPQGRQTVVDLVPTGTRVYPVGRLDADTEGLVILTNDGDLAARVTHPRHGVGKTYLARVAGNPGRVALRTLLEGVELEDGLARAREARLVSRQGGEALIELIMGEGRKREVRRLLAAVGYPVVALVRTAIGPVTASGLKPGTWRELTLDEVRSLYMG